MSIFCFRAQTITRYTRCTNNSQHLIIFNIYISSCWYSCAHPSGIVDNRTASTNPWWESRWLRRIWPTLRLLSHDLRLYQTRIQPTHNDIHMRYDLNLHMRYDLHPHRRYDHKSWKLSTNSQWRTSRCYFQAFLDRQSRNSSNSSSSTDSSSLLSFSVDCFSWAINLSFIFANSSIFDHFLLQNREIYIINNQE